MTRKETQSKKQKEDFAHRVELAGGSAMYLLLTLLQYSTFVAIAYFIITLIQYVYG